MTIREYGNANTARFLQVVVTTEFPNRYIVRPTSVNAVSCVTARKLAREDEAKNTAEVIRITFSKTIITG